MRVLLFSDHHGHAWRTYSTMTTGVPSRLLEGLDVLKEIAAVAKEERVDLILFGGDLFHHRGTLHVQTWNLIYDKVAMLRVGCQVGLLVGNHDQTNRSGDVHSIYGMSALATVMDRSRWYTFEVERTKATQRPERIHVLGVPYHKDRDVLVGALQSLTESTHFDLEPTMMLGHFGVSGAKVGSNFVLLDRNLLTLDELPHTKVDQVFLGHYHEPQELLPNVRYIGATHHHNWGDVGSIRGCWLWDTAENQKYSEPWLRPLSYPEFRRLDFGAKLTRGKVAGHFVKMEAQVIPSQAEIEVYTREAESLGARSFEVTWEQGTELATPSTVAFQPGMDTEAMIGAYVETMDHAPELDGAQLVQLGCDLIRAGT